MPQNKLAIGSGFCDSLAKVLQENRFWIFMRHKSAETPNNWVPVYVNNTAVHIGWTN